MSEVRRSRARRANIPRDVEAVRTVAAIVAELDQERLPDRIVEQAVALLGGSAGALDLIDPNSGQLVVRATHNLTTLPIGSVVPAGKGISNRVLAQRSPVVVNDYAAFADRPASRDVGAYGAALGVAVRSGGEPLGALIVFRGTDRVGFGDEDVTLLQTVADLAGIALQNARLYGEADLQRRQLTALAQAEKLRALGQMASGVAHDLNQSLALVAGYSELARQALQEDPPNLAALREAVEITARAAMDGGETVKRLLAFSRARPEGTAELLDLGELLREVAKLTAPRWRDAAQEQGRPISLYVEASGDLTARGRSASLREALTNLVFNAVDALPDGGSIRLNAQRVDDQIEVAVTDNGIGMTDEVQARIFEPFFTTKGERGTGLGLPQVFGIIERHGGQIAVESGTGRGTTVRLSLPAVSLAEAAASRGAPTPPAQAGSLRILVVDDEAALARMLARMLATDGHTVAVAVSGEEALERLAEAPYDLVISDLGMGEGMNGWELARHVRAHYPGVRFCLATGWGGQIDPAQARTAGVDSVIAKPYRHAQIRSLIASLCG